MLDQCMRLNSGQLGYNTWEYKTQLFGGLQGLKHGKGDFVPQLCFLSLARSLSPENTPFGCRTLEPTKGKYLPTFPCVCVV